VDNWNPVLTRDLYLIQTSETSRDKIQTAMNGDACFQHVAADRSFSLKNVFWGDFGVF
jgi:hypothetical protein